MPFRSKFFLIVLVEVFIGFSLTLTVKLSILKAPNWGFDLFFTFLNHLIYNSIVFFLIGAIAAFPLKYSFLILYFLVCSLV